MIQDLIENLDESMDESQTSVREEFETDFYFTVPSINRSIKRLSLPLSLQVTVSRQIT